MIERVDYYTDEEYAQAIWHKQQAYEEWLALEEEKANEAYEKLNTN